ncbi:MAG TPA: phosphoglucosamine mutase [Rickettsiales bacterium]|nr:phosphoglucosamine mutase [Rickettsiales bacterium]
MTKERIYFGTDGIRGKANTAPMTTDIAVKLGQAAGQLFLRGDHRHRVIIAKDTRLSGYMIEPALTAGFISAGMDVVLAGPLPTPAVAMLTRSMRADLGVMISASHNPFYDNGIKLFGPDGYKLSDSKEHTIENMMRTGDIKLAAPDKLGRARRLEDARGRYIEFIKNTFPKKLRLGGLKIVIDCANGAAYSIAPEVLYELGAEVISLGVNPDGFNINKDCGSTSPENVCAAVISHGADLGIALDGDADRLVMCDSKGALIDGDLLMAMIATYWHKNSMLKGGAVVATDMSNLAFERYLGGLGLKLHRAKIGDRYVVESMRSEGCNVGGEQSGHIVLSDYSTTGDGLLAALQVLAVMLESGKSLRKVSNLFTPMPQVLNNVRFKAGTAPLERKAVEEVIKSVKGELGKTGRLLVRKSGTEPLIRIMVEGEDENQIQELADRIGEAIKEAV